MVQSTEFSNVVALGKRIVQEIERNDSVDTLGRWMAHHIAELIVQAETAKESKQSSLEDRCRAAILALWDHINNFPSASNPFENLESFATTVRALNADECAYFYYAHTQDAIDSANISESAKQWLKLSREIDHSARVLIKLCILMAAEETMGNEREWIELAVAAEANELPIFRFVRVIEGELKEEEKDKEEYWKSLQKRLEQLRDIVSPSEMLAEEIKTQIKESRIN